MPQQWTRICSEKNNNNDLFFFIIFFCELELASDILEQMRLHIADWQARKEENVWRILNHNTSPCLRFTLNSIENKHYSICEVEKENKTT